MTALHPANHLDRLPATNTLGRLVAEMSRLDDDALARLRLRMHFASVLDELGRRDVGHLSEAQQAAREEHLAELLRYAKQDCFPKNRDFSDELMPYFIDADGTRCAMAHLIEQSGSADMVARIANTKNNAFVRELASDPELVRWLEKAGLAPEEAARIQPSYCAEDAPANCACEGASPDNVIALTTVVAIREEPIEDRSYAQRIATMKVDALYGESAMVEVGQQIDVPMFLEVGDSEHLQVTADGELKKTWQFPATGFTGGCIFGQVVTVDTDTALDALRSDTCAAQLAAVDESWSEQPECSGSGPMGCSVSTLSTTPGAAAVLFAIATAMLIARRRR